MQLSSIRHTGSIAGAILEGLPSSVKYITSDDNIYLHAKGQLSVTARIRTEQLTKQLQNPEEFSQTFYQYTGLPLTRHTQFLDQLSTTLKIRYLSALYAYVTGAVIPRTEIPDGLSTYLSPHQNIDILPFLGHSQGRLDLRQREFWKKSKHTPYADHHFGLLAAHNESPFAIATFDLAFFGQGQLYRPKCIIVQNTADPENNLAIYLGQIQGLKGENTAKTTKFAPIFVTVAEELARRLGAQAVVIQSVRNNPWAGGHLNLTRGFQIYDLTAKKLGYQPFQTQAPHPDWIKRLT